MTVKNGFQLILLLIFGSYCSFAQSNEQRTKAGSVLDAARQATQVAKAPGGLVLSGSILRVTKLDNGTSIVDTGTFENSYDLKGQRVKLKEIVDQGVSKANGPVESSDIRITTNELVNGALVYSTSDVRKVGVKLVLPLGTPTKEEIESSLKTKAFLGTLPFVLRPFFATPTEDFAFAGIAESKDLRADILTLTVEGVTYSLYFNQVDHHLLMLAYEFSDKGTSTSVKQYFSDFKKFEGRLVPTTVKMEKHISLNGNSHRIVTEAYDIKSLKFDPTFTADLFK